MSDCILEIKKEEMYQKALVDQAKNAVFTVSQTEKIIELDKLYNSCILEAINELRHKLCNLVTQEDICEIKQDIKKLESLVGTIPLMNIEIDHLIKYSEKNTNDVNKLECNVNKLECDVNKLEEMIKVLTCKYKKLGDKVSSEFLLQTKMIVELAESSKTVNDNQNSKIYDLNCEIESLKCDLNRLENQLDCNLKDCKLDDIFCKMDKLSSKVELADVIERLICVEKRNFIDERIEDVLKRIKFLECKDNKDERIEDILRRLLILEQCNFKDERVDAILDIISDLVTKKDLCSIKQEICDIKCKKFRDDRVDDILCILNKFCTIDEVIKIKTRIEILENMKLCDDRVDDLIIIINKMRLDIDRLECSDNKMKVDINELVISDNKMKVDINGLVHSDNQLKSEICELKVIIGKLVKENKEQNVIIRNLNAGHISQENQIKCLSTSVKRTDIILDTKINNVEKHVLNDERIDNNQNANICTLQTEIKALNDKLNLFMKQDIISKC